MDSLPRYTWVHKKGTGMTSGYTIPPSAAMLTDLYQLTMAYGYWKTGRAGHEAVFNLVFRENPFGGGYSVACGLAYVIDYISSLRFEESDIRYLETFRGNDGRPLFEPAFLDYLLRLKITCDLYAFPRALWSFPRSRSSVCRGRCLNASFSKPRF